MSLVKYANLQHISDFRGTLSILEANRNIPFEVKRVYFITSLQKDHPRGFHAHKELRQAALCIKGSCEVLLDNGSEKCLVKLDTPFNAILIEPLIWHEMSNFSEDCIFVVFASDYYSENDYIRDYNEFKGLVNVNM